MDISSLPFVRSSRTVRRADRRAPTPVAQSSSHPPDYSGDVATSFLAQSGGYLKATVQRPQQQQFDSYGITLPLLELDSGDYGSLKDLPNPSKLRKRGQATESTSQQKKRKCEDRPDVFDHLAQLRRKQHRFELESRPQEAQEVPISPMLQLRDTQTTTDLNLSFHGRTPVKSTTSKAYSHGSRDLSPIGSSITHFPPLCDTSETHLHNESITNSCAYSSYNSEYLTHQTMNESSDFGHFESESARQPRSSQDVFLELAERSHQSTQAGGHLELPQRDVELDTSFSVPSLDREHTQNVADHEVPILHGPIQSSPSLSLTMPSLPEGDSPEPCTLDIATFSITRYYPREE